jgi:hypothetical protein
MLEQGKIAESDANMGAPIIFVPKLKGELRHWVDYRRLNVVTIKDPLSFATDGRVKGLSSRL